MGPDRLSRKVGKKLQIKLRKISLITRRKPEFMHYGTVLTNKIYSQFLCSCQNAVQSYRSVTVKLLSTWIFLTTNWDKYSKKQLTSLVVQLPESLTTNHEVPGSIPGSTVGIFLQGKDSHGDHGLGRLVEFRFKAPPGTTSSSITAHTSLGQRNCASWASQPQKSVTLLPCPGGRTTKSTKDMWWHWKEKEQ